MRDAVDSTVRDIMRGALGAWGSLEHSMSLKAGKDSGAVDIRVAAGLLIASVRRGESPIGPVWHIELGDRRERVFPSVVTALRYLRGHICPQREAGRVLFGSGESQ
jgi:hypothetical protein